MELQIPTAEPVMVERQEPLTASLVDHLFLYHKFTKNNAISTEMAIANIMCSPLPKILVRHLKCSLQTNANDMVSILNGIDPSGITYTVSKMRDHLMKGLENKNITVFPHRKLSVVREPLIKVTGIPLFCTSRMPDFGFMFTC